MIDTLEFRRRLIAAGYTDADADKAVAIVFDAVGRRVKRPESPEECSRREQRRANWIFSICAVGGFLLGGAVVQAHWWADTRDRDLANLLRRAAVALEPPDVTDETREALVEDLVRAASRLDR